MVTAMADSSPAADAQAAAAEAEADAAAAEAAAAKAEAASKGAKGSVTLALVAPWTLSGFDPSVKGWGVVTREGTAGPAASVDQVMAAAKGAGIELEAR